MEILPAAMKLELVCPKLPAAVLWGKPGELLVSCALLWTPVSEHPLLYYHYSSVGPFSLLDTQNRSPRGKKLPLVSTLPSQKEISSLCFVEGTCSQFGGQNVSPVGLHWEVRWSRLQLPSTWGISRSHYVKEHLPGSVTYSASLLGTYWLVSPLSSIGLFQKF